MEDVKKKIKTLVGLEDDKQDAQIGVIIEGISNHLLYLLEKDEVPERLRYIVVEIGVRRYNRLGSEGMQQDSVEGHSVSFYDPEKDFEPYQSIIDNETEREGANGKGQVFFF
ncbi:phage head-tail connector protein [Salicibibacter halophilus]|uniref:Phage head-tail connector protein n=1 Tax=Salicibibacter halophilus TaxID=2502791 RepID=A0A514LF79_9BACI|nr:phage head-tail connector protein [Salicibibacter halophilus]QDI90215.1 phage head-tail connector protein [Salicibibacter halophilus]